MSKNNDPCSSPELVSVEQAISNILQQANAVDQVETVDLLASRGRVLAEDIQSPINVPGYDNSAMDGYAVISADCRSGVSRLNVTQRIAAGQVGDTLLTGQAARIFTGAPIPAGADAVVMQEKTETMEGQVVIQEQVRAGQNIRRAGEDIARGSVILSAGHQIRPQDMGLLASVGSAAFRVKRRLKVAVFFTGDEIVTPGEPLAAGQIYNSNRYTLNGLLAASGCELIDLGIVPDSLDATMQVLKQAASDADLVMTSGGVSVGEEDYVRIALEQLGELMLWRIAMKPGKPVAFGRVNDALFIGLPGNPVSVFTTFLIFARPLIRKLQGCTQLIPASLKIKANFDWPAVDREEYLRVRLTTIGGDTVLERYPHQGSGVLSSASWADGLVKVPIGREIQPGDPVEYIPFQGVL
jgi:molybdopterin molybdotransferase